MNDIISDFHIFIMKVLVLNALSELAVMIASASPQDLILINMI